MMTGEEATAAITATTDLRDYKIGIMYNTETGDSFILTIRGKEHFNKFAENLIDVLKGMMDDE